MSEGILRGTCSLVEGMLAERSLGIGLQLSVRCGGFSADLVLGETLGGPMAIGHLHNIYCAAKPLLSLAIGHLVDTGALDLDAPVREVLGDAQGLVPPWPATPSEILRHHAGLGDPSAMLWRMAPPKARPSLVDYRGRSKTAEYSELVGGLLLEGLIERLAGQSAVDFVMDRVVSPLGLRNEIIFDVVTRMREVLPRVRVPFGSLPTEAVPLLSERVPSQVGDLRPAFGGLATMAAIASLYSAIGQVTKGENHTALPSKATLERMLAARRGWSYDPVMQREIDFGGGFMCDIGGGGLYEDIGSQSFGHNGGFVTTIAFYDPGSDLAFALYVNGIVGPETAREPRRSIVASVYRDLREAGEIS